MSWIYHDVGKYNYASKMRYFNTFHKRKYLYFDSKAIEKCFNGSNPQYVYIGNSL